MAGHRSTREQTSASEPLAPCLGGPETFVGVCLCSLCYLCDRFLVLLFVPFIVIYHTFHFHFFGVGLKLPLEVGFHAVHLVAVLRLGTPSLGIQKVILTPDFRTLPR